LDPETGPVVFILSLKAVGMGITLTQANHVFHFDRWWNPAVENQDTDRAFRIGQKKNVFAHKFVTMGTLEERIDQMISDKQKMADSIHAALQTGQIRRRRMANVVGLPGREGRGIRRASWITLSA
jgi:SNF2 family DNA or RNA helicase